MSNTGKTSSKCKCSCGNIFNVKYRYDAKKSPIGHLCNDCKTIISKTNIIDKKFLQKVFVYDEDTGKLNYRVTQSLGKAGDTATIPQSGGYLTTRINGKDYLAHRIIWHYMTGKFPNQIDHINHKRADNKWCNLREVNNRGNHLNESLPKNSTTGVLGVSFISRLNKFRAYIVINNKQIYLGVFRTLEEACDARKKADVKYKFHTNHGSFNE